MHHEYIKADPWSIIEEGWHPDKVTSSESLMSIGNGSMGQRANFEEYYSGETFQGSYIGGIYYPDKTKVGWWKNGYPEYFAKVLNAPSWIGIDIYANEERLDLAAAESIKSFRRELNMREGWYRRSFEVSLKNGLSLTICSTRFISMSESELGAIKYDIKVLNAKAEIKIESYVDGGITNEDANWEERFWEVQNMGHDANYAFVSAQTFKTKFAVCTGVKHDFLLNDKPIKHTPKPTNTRFKQSLHYKFDINQGEVLSIIKFGGYHSSFNHPEQEIESKSTQALANLNSYDFTRLLEDQKESWAAVWRMSDITIEGDVKAQQGIRFNIFQLNQTYSGDDPRLNIGPKGFTGEKYGGSTYWDTEAYCIPFYMATKEHNVARNLLVYRYEQLDKAIENAEKLGFTNGAALYPMVTMNGEECHNEWEITFEEIHRNAAIIYGMYNYVRYTGDWEYIAEKGIEVIVAVARFWSQRVNFSEIKQAYVMLGVTGPNEYENNVNNNWYTNYMAQWCLSYALEQVIRVEEADPKHWATLSDKLNFDNAEKTRWQSIIDKMYFPKHPNKEIFLQQDGFLDKELIPVSKLATENRPINQKWSWDRILRSCYIKQADTLQGYYFFKDRFSKSEIERHFDFYEPLTVHESSLSPCVHSVLAAYIGRMDKAYEMYLRTSRLDLDDYNKEVAEGLHITSMAGTWSSIVEGFGGWSMEDDKLSFKPIIPSQWKSYSFKINFRSTIVELYKSQKKTVITQYGDKDLQVKLFDKTINLKPNESYSI